MVAKETSAETKRTDFYDGMSREQISAIQFKVNQVFEAHAGHDQPRKMTDGVANQNFIDNVRNAQAWLGFRKPDGNWGEKSDAKYDKKIGISPPGSDQLAIRGSLEGTPKTIGPLRAVSPGKVSSGPRSAERVFSTEDSESYVTRNKDGKKIFKIEEGFVVTATLSPEKKRELKETDAKGQKIQFPVLSPEELDKEAEKEAQKRHNQEATELANALRVEGNKAWTELKERRRAELADAVLAFSMGELPPAQTLIHLAAGPVSSYAIDDPQLTLTEKDVLSHLNDSVTGGKFQLAELGRLKRMDLINQQTYLAGIQALEKKSKPAAEAVAIAPAAPAPVKRPKEEEKPPSSPPAVAVEAPKPSGPTIFDRARDFVGSVIGSPPAQLADFSELDKIRAAVNGGSARVTSDEKRFVTLQVGEEKYTVTTTEYSRMLRQRDELVTKQKREEEEARAKAARAEAEPSRIPRAAAQNAPTTKPPTEVIKMPPELRQPPAAQKVAKPPEEEEEKPAKKAPKPRTPEQERMAREIANMGFLRQLKAPRPLVFDTAPDRAFEGVGGLSVKESEGGLKTRGSGTTATVKGIGQLRAGGPGEVSSGKKGAEKTGKAIAEKPQLDVSNPGALEDQLRTRADGGSSKYYVLVKSDITGCSVIFETNKAFNDLSAAERKQAIKREIDAGRIYAPNGQLVGNTELIDLLRGKKLDFGDDPRQYLAGKFTGNIRLKTLEQ
ncbi:hypothetical protein HY988_02915 [Candidatus Micrarchaeota archaeon]|nr:hypothetical protein [Candidatus Micrarchaeota archaeon]